MLYLPFIYSYMATQAFWEKAIEAQAKAMSAMLPISR